MSSEEHDLSEQLRRRVAQLHEQNLEQSAPLGAAARARVLAELVHAAPRLAAKRRRRQLVGGGAVLLAAAAVALLWLRPTQTSLPPQAASNAQPSPAACALPVLAKDQPLATLPDGRRGLALDKFGELVLDDSARAVVEQSSACELVVRLANGTLAGDLHSLRPARLSIRTEQGDVVVTGTRFAVRSAQALEVMLVSGVVDVVFSDRSSLRMQAGTRLRKPSARARSEATGLSAEDVQRVSDLLAGTAHASASPAAVSSSEPSVTPSKSPRTPAPDWLDVAEAARRAGRYPQARAAYRAASERGDDSAEVALLRWVHLELDVMHTPSAALRVLELHAQRFAHGRLGAEAGWLEVQVQKALAQPDRARDAARRLLVQHAGTPQAAAARHMLAEP